MLAGKEKETKSSNHSVLHSWNPKMAKYIQKKKIKWNYSAKVNSSKTVMAYENGVCRTKKERKIIYKIHMYIKNDT